MKRSLVLLLLLSPILFQAQTPKKQKKYPSLLWEITGKGLKKPSYLFGTMHVSSKIAFNLADSFYLGIRNADIVALETNPESWQEDMSNYELGQEANSSFLRYGSFQSAPDDYLNINTLKFYKYDKKIETALFNNPSTINNLLYRTYGNESSDFEEDTYLDMYIYQCGKKWGKRVAGVEKYAESMKLMQEAYKDAARDMNKRERGYDVDEEYSATKLQEAYRKGNLDQLDSINKLNSFSEAFDEKFLYKRNEIQANSIDSILSSKASLFAGVGAAHLPGYRGVIEILRRKGYKLRPIMMGERDSRHKEEVEKVRVPVVFHTDTVEDKLFTVDIPGRFYKFGEDGSLDQRQYADMANGSYYMITRIMTNAWMWGHGTEEVYRKIDSLLYENIPGKIVRKTKLERNGYPGFDIINKTRRGDIQRYNIYVTPFEIIFFKMSGNGEYVKNGEEANKFFGSIRFREYGAVNERQWQGWIKYRPLYGGFSIQLPHTPYIGNDGSWIYDATDKNTNTFYRLIRTDVHNYHFVEEDSFDLSLMDESFSSSEFINKQVSRKQTQFKGYPALDCKYTAKNGGIYITRYLIQGPHYYTLIAYGKKETPVMQQFLDSFEIIPYQYGEAKAGTDTSLYFKFESPVFPETKKQKLEFPRFSYLGVEEDIDEKDQLEEGIYRTRIISNDTTGEKIYVAFYKSSRYFYRKDSTGMDSDDEVSVMGDTSWIVKSNKISRLSNGMKVRDIVVTDTGSSRSIRTKKFVRNGVGFILMTQQDTLGKSSAFVRSFFDSFSPADTLNGVDLFQKKSDLFFRDFMSSDSMVHKMAVRNIKDIYLDSTDWPGLKKAINSLTFKEKRYLSVKKMLLAKLGRIKTREASDYLRDTYYAAGDTIELQYTALETLLRQRTDYAYSVFRDIIVSEPPVLEKNTERNFSYSNILREDAFARRFQGYDGSFLDELHDSLLLTRTILPDLLPLLNLDDYKGAMMNLLARMIDSNLVKPGDYELYFNKLLLEAKQEMKKQAIAERKKAIERAEENKVARKSSTAVVEYVSDGGNDDLSLYSRLLLPYWDKQKAVQGLFQQMLRSNDRQLKYNSLIALMRNNKPHPDSLLDYFAMLDEYRYDLYRDLKKMGRSAKFPVKYNNHLDLGKSRLLTSKEYGKPDTLVYIDKMRADLKNKKGFIYFYKYKSKKEDMTWKLATVGLVPEDPKQFEFAEGKEKASENQLFTDLAQARKLNYTNLSDTKINDDEPLAEQLRKELRKIVFSTRKSAKEFYGDVDREDEYEE